jgi:hypothetical protein
VSKCKPKQIWMDNETAHRYIKALIKIALSDNVVPSADLIAIAMVALRWKEAK